MHNLHTLHPSLFPVVFSHSLSLFLAPSPPELRVIGSDISMPASHSTNAAKQKKRHNAWIITHTAVHIHKLGKHILAAHIYTDTA